MKIVEKANLWVDIRAPVPADKRSALFLDRDGTLIEFVDYLSDPSAVAPDDAVARRLLGAAVLVALEELDAREKDVVRMRFGLDGSEPMTLEQVGAHFGVTRERVRQIEARTMSKLKQPNRSQKLRDYFDEG